MLTARPFFFFFSVRHKQSHRIPNTDKNTLRPLENETKQGHFIILSKPKQNPSHYAFHNRPNHRIAPTSDSIWSRENPCFFVPLPIIHPKYQLYHSFFLTHSYWDSVRSSMCDVCFFYDDVCFFTAMSKNPCCWIIAMFLVILGWRALTHYSGEYSSWPHIQSINIWRVF